MTDAVEGILARRRRRGARIVELARRAESAAPRDRGAGAGIDGVGRDQERAHLGLIGLVQDKSLAGRVDAIDEAAFIGAGVERPFVADRQAQDVLLLGRIEDAGGAGGGEAIDFPLGPRAGEDALRGRIVGQGPDVGIECLRGGLHLAIGRDAQQLPGRPGAGVNRAIGRGGEAEDVRILAGVKDGRFAVGADLVESAFVAGGGGVEVARFILGEVPHVADVETGERLDLARQLEHPFAGDDALGELRLVEAALRILLPDLDLGPLSRRQKDEEDGKDEKGAANSHARFLFLKGARGLLASSSRMGRILARQKRERIECIRWWRYKLKEKKQSTCLNHRWLLGGVRGLRDEAKRQLRPAPIPLIFPRGPNCKFAVVQAPARPHKQRHRGRAEACTTGKFQFGPRGVQ